MEILETLFDPDIGVFERFSALAYAFIHMFILGIISTVVGLLTYSNIDLIAIVLIGVSIIYTIVVLVNFFKLKLYQGLRGILALIYMVLSILVIYSTGY